MGRCSADGSVGGGPTGCQVADHTVSGPAFGMAVQSWRTNSSDVLLPEECGAHTCGCNLTWGGWYYWEGSFKNISVSLLVVVIYHIFILPLVPVSLHWQLQEAGFSLGWLHAPSISHTAPWMAPLVGFLAFLITSTPVKWLDECCSEAVNASPWPVSFTVPWIIYFRIFFQGPNSPTDKWAAGLCREYCPNVAKYWLHKGDIKLLFINLNVLKAFLLALSVVGGVLASPEFSNEPDFNMWYFCTPIWCLVLCICGNVDFMTTVKTHLLWLKFMKWFQIDSCVGFLPLNLTKRGKKSWLEFSSSETLRILIDLGHKATRSSWAKDFKWRWPLSGSSEKLKNAF